VNWTQEQLAAHQARMVTSVPSRTSTGLLLPGMGKPAKYRNVKTVVDGHTFDSKLEAGHYQALKILADRGLISDLVLQPSFMLQEAFTDGAGKKHRAIVYRGDFSFVRDGKLVVVDSKSPASLTPVFRLKQKMFLKRYPDYTLEIWAK
jgi:hypothetical protein